MTAPSAGMLRTVPHHVQPPCCPCHRRNRKPFRVGGRGRPAGASGRRTQHTGPPSTQIEARTEEPSTLVTTATSAQAQPSAELRRRCGKQQHGGQIHPARAPAGRPYLSSPPYSRKRPCAERSTGWHDSTQHAYHVSCNIGYLVREQGLAGWLTSTRSGEKPPCHSPTWAQPGPVVPETVADS